MKYELTDTSQFLIRYGAVIDDIDGQQTLLIDKETALELMKVLAQWQDDKPYYLYRLKPLSERP